MALIGYGRVSTDAQNTQRQLDALEDAGCIRIYTEKISGKIRWKDRPELARAIDQLRDGDMLCVQEIDRLGRNMIDGMIMLSELFDDGYPVKVLEGIAAGEHRQRSFLIDISFAMAEERRREISRKTKNGLESAKRSGVKLGRKPVVDDDKRRAILARHAEGQSIRAIAKGVGVSVGVVHKTVQTGNEVD